MAGETAGTGVTANSPTGIADWRRHYTLVILIVIYGVNFIDRTIINVLVQPIKMDLDLSDTQIGMVTGFAFALLYGTMGLPFAWVAERHSRVKLISITLAFWSVMTAACGLAHNFLQLFLARIGVGIGEAACSPSAQSMISDLYGPNRRSTALAAYSMGSPLGSLFGALCGGWIAQEFGWRHAFVIVGLPGVLIALFVWLTIREPIRGAYDGAKASDEAPPILATLKRLWSLSVFRHIAMGFALTSLSGYSIVTFIMAYAQRQFQVSIMEASFAFGIIYGALGAVGILLGGIASDWAGKRDVRMYGWIPAGALLICAPLLMLALMQKSGTMLALMSILPAMLYPMYMGPGYATAHNIVAPRMRATATVVLLMMSSLIGLGIGPTATGWISDMSARRFFEGDFAASCYGAATLPAACREAEAQGLLVALMIMAALLFWGAFHFFMAGNKTKAAMGASR